MSSQNYNFKILALQIINQISTQMQMMRTTKDSHLE